MNLLIALFQSTLLMRGATILELSSWSSIKFQSTLLMRGATKVLGIPIGFLTFQSTLLMRGATAIGGDTPQRNQISIHAPHARSDRNFSMHTAKRMNFNPRSSCEERQGGAT